MELRPGYKQTEMGVIPNDWQVRPISKYARLESGHTPSKKFPSYWGGDVPWVSLHDTERLDGNFIEKTALTISRLGLENSSARLLPAGTVVFSRTATVGKATIISRPMATSQDFANYICGPKLHNLFVVYLFRWMRPVWQSLMAGSIHNTIYMPAFERLKIVIPPLPEQQAIAGVLSDVDASIGALSRLIAKKRGLHQGAMQRLLTGQTRLPGFSAPWGGEGLGQIAEVIMGQSPSSSNYNANGDGLPLVQGNADIEDRKTTRRVFTTQLTKLGRNGDILMSVRAPVGEIAKATFDCCLGRGVCAIRHPESFLYYALMFKEPEWAKVSKGSTFDSVNSDDVKAFELLWPSDQDERTAVACVLSDMDHELAVLSARFDKMQALKQAMTQALLTGRVRLPVALQEKCVEKEAADA